MIHAPVVFNSELPVIANLSVARYWSWWAKKSYQRTPIIVWRHNAVELSPRDSSAILGHDQDTFVEVQVEGPHPQMVFSNPYHSFAALVTLSISGRRTDKGLVDFRIIQRSIVCDPFFLLCRRHWFAGTQRWRLVWKSIWKVEHLIGPD